ncbi:RNA-binding domain-containing protein [Runella zeae]|uniref:RNA-binding domain-containing protein n=1 Tax=Runella zeae TaxID=94255 RepID=UPI0023554429|nr:RNA-binding domain-containing protein [Runella zeae]
MALPINIEDLINGQTVEWERIEFKRGWNPEEMIHTLCAFANDLNNWGGGYVIVGVEENQGKAILPPFGINPSDLDAIQGEILQLAYQILPNYFPLIQPYVTSGKHILVIWCPAGDNRPYTAPTTQGKQAQRYPYIRFGSRSIIAKDDNLRRLQELTARTPFDDRINGKAHLNALDLGLIQAFLQEVKSDLYEESKRISFADLCRRMLIAKGPDEAIQPLNVGVLFFCREPDKYLERSWIELVIHTDDSGRSFTEKYFKGPLHHQLRAILDYFKANLIQEQIVKVSKQAEAERFYNYPFAALEEALANAVYHKSYELSKPIEVQLWPDRIEILSYPGPVPPVDAQILKQNQRIVARDYRNRRIGDFLKELRLTEGRGTGFPLIYRSMEANGSIKPIFETDNQSTYFLTILHKREELSNQASNQAGNQAISLWKIIQLMLEEEQKLSPKQIEKARQNLEKLNKKSLEILKFLEAEGPKKKKELFAHVNLTIQTKNTNQYLIPLLELGLIQPTIKDRPSSPLQRYLITPLGKNVLTIIV